MKIPMLFMPLLLSTQFIKAQFFDQENNQPTGFQALTQPAIPQPSSAPDFEALQAKTQEQDKAIQTLGDFLIQHGGAGQLLAIIKEQQMQLQTPQSPSRSNQQQRKQLRRKLLQNVDVFEKQAYPNQELNDPIFNILTSAPNEVSLAIDTLTQTDFNGSDRRATGDFYGYSMGKLAALYNLKKQNSPEVKPGPMGRPMHPVDVPPYRAPLWQKK